MGGNGGGSCFLSLLYSSSSSQPQNSSIRRENDCGCHAARTTYQRFHTLQKVGRRGGEEKGIARSQQLSLAPPLQINTVKSTGVGAATLGETVGEEEGDFHRRDRESEVVYSQSTCCSSQEDNNPPWRRVTCQCRQTQNSHFPFFLTGKKKQLLKELE